MINDNLENEHFFNIFEYIKENFIGLTLLLFVFFIIYFVDYINRLNMLIYAAPRSMPVLTSITSSPQKISKKKFKKK